MLFENQTSDAELLNDDMVVIHYDFTVDDDDEEITFQNIQCQAGVNLYELNTEDEAYVMPALEEDAAETYKISSIFFKCWHNIRLILSVEFVQVNPCLALNILKGNFFVVVIHCKIIVDYNHVVV